MKLDAQHRRIISEKVLPSTPENFVVQVVGGGCTISAPDRSMKRNFDGAPFSWSEVYDISLDSAFQVIPARCIY